MEMILDIIFLMLSNADILFTKQKLIGRSYILVKILPIIKQVQIIGQKKFPIAVLDLGKKTFIIYIAYLSLKILIHLTCEA